MVNKPPTIQENIPLAPYTTLKIGGPAKYFVAAKTIAELQEAVAWANQEKLPYRLIGRGANLLVSDNGFNGLIIHPENDQAQWNGDHVVVGAGVQNGQLIASALQHGFGGMQWLIGVPGKVGGSLYGNAGGHGWGLGDQVVWVDVCVPDGTNKRLTKEDCAFAYRTSIFKHHPEWSIVQAEFIFPKVDPAEERTLLAETTKQKNTNQPTTAKTAGCMFTNPTADLAKVPESLKQYVDAKGTISAWRVIEEVGLKGFQLGDIQISDVHANFMINRGQGTADQVMQLLSLIKQKVRDELGIQLHEEIQYLGF